MGKKSGSGDEYPRSLIFPRANSCGVKILQFFDEDPDPGPGIFLTLDPGGKNSDPGSAVAVKLIFGGSIKFYRYLL
jgi:hypothetical protein